MRKANPYKLSVIFVRPHTDPAADDHMEAACRAARSGRRDRRGFVAGRAAMKLAQGRRDRAVRDWLLAAGRRKTQHQHEVMQGYVMEAKQ